MNDRIVPVLGMDPRDESAWRCLADRAIEANPLGEPDSVIPAARHLPDGHAIELVIVEDDDQFLACLPVRSNRRWHGFPYRLVTSHVRRTIHLGVPLVDADHCEDATLALVAALARQRGELGRVLALQRLDDGGPVAACVRVTASKLRFPLRAFDAFDRGVLVRRDAADYGDIQNAKFRSELRRRRRRLADLLGEDPVLVDRSSDASAIEDFLALEASGYKRRSGIALATEPGEPAYFREMCMRFAAAGRLYVLALEAGDHTLAMDIWVRAADGIFALYLSYDEKFSQYAPGIQLLMAATDFFHSKTDAAWVDSCAGADNDVFLRLYPGRRHMTSFYMALTRNPLDRALLDAAMRIRPLHHRLGARRSPVPDRSQEAT
jgi:CelD/BcsL family acetyltransferase involved in cellulose biosynthesis